MLEKTIEKYLHDRMVETGGTTRKHTSPGHNGGTDRLLIMPYYVSACRHKSALIWMCEVKKPKGRVSKIQKAEQKELSDLGVTTVVIYSMDDADYIVECMRTTALGMTAKLR